MQDSHQTSHDIFCIRNTINRIEFFEMLYRFGEQRLHRLPVEDCQFNRIAEILDAIQFTLQGIRYIISNVYYRLSCLRKT